MKTFSIIFAYLYIGWIYARVSYLYGKKYYERYGTDYKYLTWEVFMVPDNNFLPVIMLLWPMVAAGQLIYVVGYYLSYLLVGLEKLITMES